MVFVQCPTRTLPRFLFFAKPFSSLNLAPCQAAVNLKTFISAAAEVAEGEEVAPLHFPSSSSDDTNHETANGDMKPRKKVFVFPKKGQRLEMLCESLAFKGKGVCKTVDTGFVVLCDRALPGERLIALITKKKGSFAEVHILNIYFLFN